ncbi:hypothetical protein IFR04_009915 [Cadophora malorum]|uniref:Uncharacterized protein n=1 Tax=Cadophora malorum TaxID=108018 RepID=A0A8H7TCI7_9HELO|nr:hypothetical protein IFR04_009915 [Cadophora malorum]
MSFLTTIEAIFGEIFAHNGGKKSGNGSNELIFPVLPHEDPAHAPKPIGVFRKGSKEPGLEVLLDGEEGEYFSGVEEEGNGAMVVPYERAPKLGV